MILIFYGSYTHQPLKKWIILLKLDFTDQMQCVHLVKGEDASMMLPMDVSIAKILEKVTRCVQVLQHNSSLDMPGECNQTLNQHTVYDDRHSICLESKAASPAQFSASVHDSTHE